MNIGHIMQRYELAIQANTEIFAGIRENFKINSDGSSVCKHCGAKCAHPRAAAAHLAVHHKGKLEGSTKGESNEQQ